MKNSIPLTAFLVLATFMASPKMAAAEEAEDFQVKAEGLKATEETRHFHQLALCRRLEGSAEVLKPGSQEWEEMEEGRFYPLGCMFRTDKKNDRLTIQFGVECEASISGEASFGCLAQPIGEKTRTLVIGEGSLDIKLSRSFPTNLFFVNSPAFRIIDAQGESRITYTRSGDGDEAKVRCVSGRIGVEGRHFSIPEMFAANEFALKTSADYLFTGIYGNSGDFVVRLDQGDFSVRNPDTGVTSIEHRTLDWKLTPKAAVRIMRAVPAVGSRLAVTVMTFNSDGELKNRCAFTEGRHEINTGEQGPKSRKEKEEIAKKAEEATAQAEKVADNADGEEE